MKKRHDLIWHIFLYIGLAVGGLGVILLRFEATRQFIVLAMLVVFYLLWGFAYHHTKGDADRRKMLEYLFIGLIAILAGFLVLVS